MYKYPNCESVCVLVVIYIFMENCVSCEHIWQCENNFCNNDRFVRYVDDVGERPGRFNGQRGKRRGRDSPRLRERYKRIRPQRGPQRTQGRDPARSDSSET